MITNLFSVFDPVRGSIISNWVILLRGLMFRRSVLFLRGGRVYIIKKYISNLLSGELKVTLGDSLAHVVLLLQSIFLIIVRINILGLFSYNFTPSSHLNTALSLGLPVWIALIWFGFVFKTRSSLAHLVPLGTPVVLVPFIVLIESVRRVIRPLTLGIRLAANMVAGHLLITLLGRYASVFSGVLRVRVISTRLVLLVLERAVALIQGYVFVVLLRLYIREV